MHALLCLLATYIITLTPPLTHEPHVGDADLVRHGLEHIVHAQSGLGGPHERLHLHAGLARGAHCAVNEHAFRAARVGCGYWGWIKVKCKG